MRGSGHVLGIGTGLTPKPKLSPALAGARKGREGGAQAHCVGEGRQLETPGNHGFQQNPAPLRALTLLVLRSPEDGWDRQALVQTSAVRKVWTPGAIY